MPDIGKAPNCDAVALQAGRMLGVEQKGVGVGVLVDVQVAIAIGVAAIVRCRRLPIEEGSSFGSHVAGGFG